MKFNATIYRAAAIVALMISTSASADALRSEVDFNTGIGEKTADQPANGIKVTYQVKLEGGDLDGCTVDIVESMYGRDGGNWGFFDIAGDVSCNSGDFAYTTTGAWDGNGFHASGTINEGSGRGEFEGFAGRVAQLGGTVAPAAAGDGTFDISYQLVIDTIHD